MIAFCLRIAAHKLSYVLFQLLFRRVKVSWNIQQLRQLLWLVSEFLDWLRLLMEEIFHQILANLVGVRCCLFNFFNHCSVSLFCGCGLQIRLGVGLTLQQCQLLHLILNVIARINLQEDHRARAHKPERSATLSGRSLESAYCCPKAFLSRFDF